MLQQAKRKRKYKHELNLNVTPPPQHTTIKPPTTYLKEKGNNDGLTATLIVTMSLPGKKDADTLTFLFPMTDSEAYTPYGLRRLHVRLKDLVTIDEWGYVKAIGYWKKSKSVAYGSSLSPD